MININFEEIYNKLTNKKLDKNQLKAVYSNNNTLVLAGAGCGKSTTIIGKIIYLIYIKQVNPKNILVLSFTKETVNEMNIKLNDLNIYVNVYTFHKLGLHIIGNNYNIYNKSLSLYIKKYLLRNIENKVYKKELSRLLNMKNFDLNKTVLIFEKVINLLKTNEIPNNLNKKEIKLLNYIKQVYNLYNKYLIKTNQIDFNDMINISTKKVLNNEYIHNYKYIIVDEFQDISYQRYKLLLTLKNQKNYNLFCVGDDYQSIYQFAGSKIFLITNFEKYFGKTSIVKINQTYRFSNELAIISSKFIMKNKNQINKNIKSNKKLNKPVIIINTNKNNINKNLQNYINKLEYNSTLLLLGRYTSDINIIKNDNYIFINNKIINKYRKDLKIKFYTVHSSKGLEADNVIILNNLNSTYGFPSKVKSISLINKLNNIEKNYLLEERRLFYVAITRTKNRVYLLTIKSKKSIFIKEIKYIIKNMI